MTETAGERWRKACDAYVSSEGPPSIAYARRAAAAAEMQRLESAYADGSMCRDDRLSLWAEMEARKLPPLTPEQCSVIGAIARRMDGRATPVTPAPHDEADRPT